LKFSTSEKVTCSLDFRTTKMLIQIEDSGIGIDQAVSRQIYQPFFRAENARIFQGQGIGLALSEKIILLHQGQISFESELNKGTIFTIVFNLELFD